MSSQSVPDLLVKARSIASDRHSPLDLLTELEEFSQCFQEWFQSVTSEDLNDPQVTELMVEHERLLTLARSLHKDTGQERRELKKRAKGIIRYIDVLPSRVSTRRPKRG
jgi:hypothetical protein